MPHDAYPNALDTLTPEEIPHLLDQRLIAAVAPSRWGDHRDEAVARGASGDRSRRPGQPAPPSFPTSPTRRLRPLGASV